MDTENSYIISPFFVSKVKPFTLIGIPFCEKNENKPKDFIKKFLHLTNGKYCISINWITKKS